MIRINTVLQFTGCVRQPASRSAAHLAPGVPISSTTAPVMLTAPLPATAARTL